MLGILEGGGVRAQITVALEGDSVSVARDTCNQEQVITCSQSDSARRGCNYSLGDFVPVVG